MHAGNYSLFITFLKRSKAWKQWLEEYIYIFFLTSRPYSLIFFVFPPSKSKNLKFHVFFFLISGPEIFKCKGCTINWKEPGKNLTVKTVKKKQKHKSKGNVRTITKQVKNDSFFNFFDPPPISDDPEADVDPETQVIWKKQKKTRQIKTVKTG